MEFWHKKTDKEKRWEEEEAEAIHQGRLKYLKKEAAKGGKKKGGFWDIGESLKGIAVNASNAKIR